MSFLKYANPAFLYRRRSLAREYLRNYAGDTGRWIVRRAYRCRADLAGRGVGLTRNDRRLAELRDKHRGRRCFIVGNGNSLLVEDLERLRGEITFGSNRVFVGFDRTSWRPTYYSVIDYAGLDPDTVAAIRGLGAVKIISGLCRSHMGDCPDAIYVRPLPYAFRDPAAYPNFSKDLLVGAEFGATVTLLQLQAAFYMGFSRVYLVGIDFNYDVSKSTPFVKDKITFMISGGEPNYFHKDYLRAGTTITRPNLAIQREGYRRSLEVFAGAGRALLNASRQTALEVIPRVSLDEVLSAPSEGKSDYASPPA